MHPEPTQYDLGRGESIRTLNERDANAPSVEQPDTPAKTIRLPLGTAATSHFDLNAYTTPKRFRLLDCKMCLAEENSLIILEMPHIPHVGYATVSYARKGLPCEIRLPDTTRFLTSTAGACAGDAINLDIVYLLCRLSLERGISYLWIDRLCVSTKKTDRRWNSGLVGQIFRNCHQCFVLPGGLTRIADLQETTCYTDPPLILQVVLPPSCLVVFTSTLALLSNFATVIDPVKHIYVCEIHRLMVHASVNPAVNILILGGREHASFRYLLDSLTLKSCTSWKDRYQISYALWTGALAHGLGDPSELHSILKLMDAAVDDGVQDAVSAPRERGFMDPYYFSFLKAVQDHSRVVHPAWQDMVDSISSSGPIIPDGVHVFMHIDASLPYRLAQIQPSFFTSAQTETVEVANSPVYLGSVVTDDGLSVQPCRLYRSTAGWMCEYSYRGLRCWRREGHVYMLNLDPGEMEWVSTSEGRIPRGRLPIPAGHEQDGRSGLLKLFHACVLYHEGDTSRAKRRMGAVTADSMQPGLNLGDIHQPFYVQHFDVLCWKRSLHT
ncbi:hypothetical protein NM688_g6813 [Phlebia brevispora]|uniref:Uncharacterized protein n=1 Tax=Phlebia brevispora TaxID=194682 RepID=A0ACC1SC46_9APHY|nr:hypothetical protein NM688_g6813 [Phlebia brevispora]